MWHCLGYQQIHIPETIDAEIRSLRNQSQTKEGGISYPKRNHIPTASLLKPSAFCTKVSRRELPRVVVKKMPDDDCDAALERDLSTFKYRVNAHETISGIAIKFNCEEQQLRRSNKNASSDQVMLARGFVRVPLMDRDGKKIRASCADGTGDAVGSTERNSGNDGAVVVKKTSLAIEKLRLHYSLNDDDDDDKAKKNVRDSEDDKEIRYEYEPKARDIVGRNGTTKVVSLRKKDSNGSGFEEPPPSQSSSSRNAKAESSCSMNSSSQFARDKPLFTPNKLGNNNNSSSSSDATIIHMEGNGIRAAIKYNLKTSFSKMKTKALDLTADLREEKRIRNQSASLDFDDIRGPVAKGKGD